jgi:hypothetical protein
MEMKLVLNNVNMRISVIIMRSETMMVILMLNRIMMNQILGKDEYLNP